MFQLPPEVDLTNVALYIPYDDVLLAMNALHLYPDTMRYACLLIILSIIKCPILFLVMYDIIRSITCESLFCCSMQKL